MRAYVVICAALVAIATVQGQKTVQDQETLQGTVQDQETTKPAVKYIDYSSLKKFTRAPSVEQTSSGSSSGSQNQQPTVPLVPHTTRPDPRATPTPSPELTLPPTPAPTPAPTPPPVPFELKWIGHDEVKPFPQPEPVTISDKAGVKFKPQIQIRTGCNPYPAVNEFGEVGGGLKTSGKSRGNCAGSGHGSQVYGRSTWHNQVWAIMYSWYFPKDSPSPGMGHRHDWEHAVVFIDNPDVPEPKILGCSVSSHDGYKKYNPCPPWVIDGTSLKVRYKHSWPINHDLDTTGDGGIFQDLIMWGQMTDNARRALNEANFGSANTPMNDGNFYSKVEKSWPF
uniref:Necrosis inducing-like protein NPP1 type n=1 Tax=Phytophthora ramorum TaxID=164328 RepID=H3GFU3_PHYRM